MPNDERSKKIAIIGPFPPPTNGAAKNTKKISNDLRQSGFRVKIFDILPKYKDNSKGIIYYINKLTIGLEIFFSIIFKIDREEKLYIFVEGGRGAWMTLLYSLALKMKSRNHVWAHHRSCPNLSKKNMPIFLFDRILGKQLTHIFLDVKMKNDFEKNYRKIDNFIILNNSATCDVDTRNSERCGPINVGYLSNLSKDKGFDIAIQAFEKILNFDNTAMILIGGQPEDKYSKNLLKYAMEKFGKNVEYYGHVTNEDKQEYFEKIDIFLFPTTYYFEAQPNVIYEAMASGAFNIATNHACIPNMLEGAPHALVSVSDDRNGMIEDMALELEHAIKLMHIPEKRRTIRRQVQQRFSDIQQCAKSDYARFLKHDLGESID